MTRPNRRRTAKPKLIAGVLALAAMSACPVVYGQRAAAPAAPRPSAGALPAELTGRTIEEVRIIGKNRALSSETVSTVYNQVRSREGTKFEPATVESDYQRIYGLKKFSNVEARVEPTATGVIVVFEVTEPRTITDIRIRGNDDLDTESIQQVISLKRGEAIDDFRIGLAKESIARLYQSKNFPYTHVEVDQEELAKGVVVFTIVEGPKVRVRRVKILGNKTFSDARLKDEIKTKAWFPLFVSGEYDPDQIEQDVASIRLYYENHGFFDVRVGRKIVVSPNQKEVAVVFVVEEGQRYKVDKVSFKVTRPEGVSDPVTDDDLRFKYVYGIPIISEEDRKVGQQKPGDKKEDRLKLQPGMFYDNDLIKRDQREIVRVFSPFGYIYQPNELTPDPEYMRIAEQKIYRPETGTVDVVYNISTGRPFYVGRLIIKGNAKALDKVVLREVRLQSGQLYDSDALQRSQDRIRGTGLFSGVTMTPIVPTAINPNEPLAANPEEPGVTATRDLLIEVNEAQTAKFLIGAGITSNSGVLGQISYEQRNFDITNWPSSTTEMFSNRAFTGAGQTFRISLEPGTELTRARVDFVEPYLFDTPYSFGSSVYLSQRRRDAWDEDRVGARLSIGKRFSDIWSARVFGRGEDVQIRNIGDEELRAPEILELEGHSTITSAGLEISRNTTNSVILPSTGTLTTFTWEHAGTFGGDFDFDKYTLGFNWYQSIYEDLLDRKTILAIRTDTGYISGDAPFFERFYAGGIGSVRGFRFRGISPRSGIDDDAIGGDFMVTGSAELSFPLAGDTLRGVLFADAGTVNRDVSLGTIRTSVGFGFRLTLPFFGQVPIALDFGFPITKDDKDETRLFSFSLGLTQ